MKINKENLAGGSILILLGVFFLLVQILPGFDDWLGDNWPLIIMGAGGIFLLSAILWTPDLAIPGSIVGGIGGLLFWQNTTGNWESWAYAWTLIPGFVGVGLILSDLLKKNFRLPNGGPILLFLSLIGFAFFGTFLGGPADLLRYWPVLLIGLGLWQLLRALRVPAS